MSVSAQLERTGSAGPGSAGPDPLAFRGRNGAPVLDGVAGAVELPGAWGSRA